MNERDFINKFTTEYSQLLNNLEISDRYNDSLDERKMLIIESYNKLKLLSESYLDITLNEISPSNKTQLDFQHTEAGMFGWLHWMLKDTDLKRAVNRLLYTLNNAV